MYVCLCHGVSDKKIRKLAIDEGVLLFEDYLVSLTPSHLLLKLIEAK